MNDFFPLVSIITTAYNNYCCFEDTVKSVLSQDYPKIEYIVSDDSSANFDRNKIESIITKYKQENLVNYSVIYHKENVGTVKNLNEAVKKSKGDYIISLSSEDYFTSNNIVSSIISRMKENNCEIITYTRIKYNNGKKLYKIPSQFYYNYLSKLDDCKKQFSALVSCRYYELASGSSVCFKRTLLEKLGFFDESYVYWEDGPFFAKCNIEGTVIDKAYDIYGVYYKAGGISNSKTVSKASVGIKNDSIRFYSEIINNYSKELNNNDLRRVKYALERLEANTNSKKMFIKFRYLDVFIQNQIIKIKIYIAERKEYKILNSRTNNYGKI